MAEFALIINVFYILLVKKKEHVYLLSGTVFFFFLILTFCPQPNCRQLQNIVLRGNFMIYYSQGSIPSCKIVKRLIKRMADVIDFLQQSCLYSCCLLFVFFQELRSGIRSADSCTYIFPCNISEHFWSSLLSSDKMFC